MLLEEVFLSQGPSLVTYFTAGLRENVTVLCTRVSSSTTECLDCWRVFPGGTMRPAGQLEAGHADPPGDLVFKVQADGDPWWQQIRAKLWVCEAPSHSTPREMNRYLEKQPAPPARKQAPNNCMTR